MTHQTLLNLAGLIINMAGSYLMFSNSSKVQSGIYIYTDTELTELRKKDKRKNNLIRLGMLLLFVGFTFQFIALL